MDLYIIEKDYKRKVKLDDIIQSFKKSYIRLYNKYKNKFEYMFEDIILDYCMKMIH